MKPTNKSWAPLQKGYEILDKILDQNKGKYAIGDNLTIADFSLVTTLTSWGVLLPYDGLANVQRYVENVQKLPCYDANREGLETFKQIVEDTFKKFETTKKWFVVHLVNLRQQNSSFRSCNAIRNIIRYIYVK